ncbi:YqaJ viral recombinase family protein [Cryobacterium sp. 1639]|uniref:YqaJ viral recombinase family protein n=1 Tax=Cryobacterium inferilacus TaxID=2866629 RepID=UPI001C72B9A6|nr:YqaJ viral recombinase family protein [Cryobacterium sp. 1639]MBX0300680.1 YqaJ viral recombinase family protein [Cryobacterium sp. 1639]
MDDVPHSLLSLFDLEEQTPAEAPPAVALPPLPHLGRIVADSTNRVAWLRARSQGITATDVAKLATEKSVHAAAREKINGSGFSGNPFTDHGRAREPEIAAWVQANYGIEPSTNLFHAAGQPRHLATPDGLGLAGNGVFELAEIKTTSKPWRSIPRSYLRQIWWQQYVLGADRTLLVWEEHDNFVPRSAVPECRWIDRDDDQISILVGYANQLIDLLNHQRERERADAPPPYDYQYDHNRSSAPPPYDYGR